MNKEEKRKKIKNLQGRLDGSERLLDELDTFRGDSSGWYISSYNTWKRIPQYLHDPIREILVSKECELLDDIDNLLK